MDLGSSPLRDKAAGPRRGRSINVYDAVAGRVTLHESLRSSGRDSDTGKHRPKAQIPATYSSRDPRLAPEDVLFRRKHAPVRYAENDIYWASDDLRDGGRNDLPDSDLLKSVHGYASRFYEARAGRVGPRSRTVDERSMDETALLAFGILLEEAGREALGSRGDLVFTEGSGEDLVDETNLGATVGAGGTDSGSVRLPKRRRIVKDE